jgi:hypothetical protein
VGVASSSNTTSMESLFSPTTRYRDLLNERAPNHVTLPENFREVELSVSLEELKLSRHATWDAFVEFVRGDKVVWMAPGVFISVSCSRYHHNKLYPQLLHLAQLQTSAKLSVFASCAQQAVETCDFVVHLLAASEHPIVACWGTRQILPVSGSGLLDLATKTSHARLRELSLRYLILDESHCRTLATASHDNLQVGLFNCSFADAGTNTVLHSLQHDQGPTELFQCWIDAGSLASALGRNRGLKRLTMNQDLVESEMLAIGQALATNQGLEHLSLCGQSISDNNWNTMCNSLRTHLKLKSLDLFHTQDVLWTEKKRATRIRAVAAMLLSNTVLEKIYFSPSEVDEQLFKDVISPRLEMNRSLFESQRQAVQLVPCSQRPKLLGRALYAVRYNPNLVWMFLSENIDVAAQHIQAIA